MNTQQKSWLIHLGHFPVPPHLYLSSEQQEAKEIKDLELSDPVRKLNRGILALVRNKNEIPRDEIYNILKDRGFLPVVAEDHLLGMDRFCFYYYKLLKERNIKRAKPKTLKQKVLENMHNMTMREMAAKFGVRYKAVREVIYKHNKWDKK